MFQNIVKITDNIASVILNKTGNMLPDLMNMHVVFESGNSKILGEVKDITKDTVDIKFLGEFTEKGFTAGIIRKPSLNSRVRMINESELQKIIGTNVVGSFLLGKSPLYNNYPIYVDINEMFSNHFAIFGASGSGKSCGVARTIQNIFGNTNMGVYNANLIFFDAYGEYKNAFSALNQVNSNYNYKFITANRTNDMDADLKIPIYLLTLDDLALLLNATEHSQLIILERALKLVKVFSKNDELSLKIKNHLIAKAIMAVLFSNKSPSGKKNEIFKIIHKTNTPQFNLNAQLQGIGFTRSFAECFEVDLNGNFSEMVLVNEYLNSFIDDSLEEKLSNDLEYFTVDNLEAALEFTLISEGFQENSTLQNASTIMLVRLHSLLNSNNRKLFEYPDFVTMEQYITSLVVKQNTRCQIININLEGLDDNLAKVIVKIFARMFFEFAKSRPNRASIPFHLFLEEAHRYVQKDNDLFLIGYNIFDRIAKEGRKYGVLLDIISQRPVELSDTVVSQISNFLIFKMSHPADLAYIEKMLPNMSADIIDKMSSLQPGVCVGFGSAFKIPFIVRLDMPNPTPYSSNCDVITAWK